MRKRIKSSNELKDFALFGSILGNIIQAFKQIDTANNLQSVKQALHEVIDDKVRMESAVKGLQIMKLSLDRKVKELETENISLVKKLLEKDAEIVRLTKELQESKGK